MIDTAQQPISFDSQQHLLAERAAQWIAKHPDAMALFERFALDMANAGQPFGIALLVERARWEWKIGKDAGAEWALNNSHRAMIARELIRRHPRLADFMHTRASKYEVTP